VQGTQHAHHIYSRHIMHQTTDALNYRETDREKECVREPEKVADMSHVATLNQIKRALNAKCA